MLILEISTVWSLEGFRNENKFVHEAHITEMVESHLLLTDTVEGLNLCFYLNNCHMLLLEHKFMSQSLSTE